LIFGGNAVAKPVSEKAFFDFNFAKSLWSNFDREALFAYDKEHCPADGAYEKWMLDYSKKPAEMMKKLDNHPKADVIKKCYDTYLTYEVWNEAYGSWRNDLSVYGSNGWNKDDTKKGFRCSVVSMVNIFTHKCTDLPDWRHPDNVKEDEAWIQQGNARWIKKKSQKTD
jgi:hypothetical protein